MTFCAAYQKPQSAPIKGGKIPVEIAYSKAVMVNEKEIQCLQLSDSEAQIEVRQDPLYGTIWDNGDVLIAIGIDDEHALDIWGDYGDWIEPDENGIIPGMIGGITTAINEVQPDGSLKARQITLKGEPPKEIAVEELP